MGQDRHTVGFIGVGLMGAPMARRLLDVGFDVVVWNRTRARAEELSLSGAAVAETPSEVSAQCEVVLSCLLDSDVVRDVYTGPDGVLLAARPGQVLVEHGTFAPALANSVAAQATDRGATFLDAPVSGGPEGATAGTLAVMVGGERGGLEVVRPVLDTFAAKVVHIGPSGAALRLKLVNQLLVTYHTIGAAEALVMLERMDLDIETATSVLQSGFAASALLGRTLSMASSPPVQGGAPIGGMLELQRLVANEAELLGVDLRLLDRAREIFAEAVDADLGATDLSFLAELYR